MAEYTFSVYFVDDSGQPILTGAVITVSAYDEDTNEWYDFSDDTFKTTPVTQETTATHSGNGVYAVVFDPTTWGNRRIHFSALSVYGTISRFTERVETFRFGSYVPISAVEPPSYGYVTVAEARTYGITEDMATDLQLTRMITLASLLIDKYTGQWFNLRNLELQIDFNGGRWAFLPTMLVNLESIYYEDDYNSIEVPTDEVRIYNKIPEDYDDPRIYFLYPPSLPFPTSPASLTRGEVSLLITGDWGLTADIYGTVIEPVKRACLIALSTLLGYETIDGEDDSMRQFIVMETTDRHQYTLSSARLSLMSNVNTLLPMAARLLLEPFMAPRVLH